MNHPNTNFDILLNPAKYGYEMCPHCNGYGSSLKDPEYVDICTMCHGSGLIKGEAKKGKEEDHG